MTSIRFMLFGVWIVFAVPINGAAAQCETIADAERMLQSRVEQLQQDYPLTYAILCNASGRAQVRGDAELAAPLVENIPLRMSLGFVRCSIWTSRADCEHVLDAVADIYDSVQELEDWAHDRNCPPPSLVWGEEC